MSKNNFDLAKLFPRAVLGSGDHYLARILHIPVLPEVFDVLAQASVALHTPSGMGGSFSLKDVMTAKKDGKYVFAVDHDEFQFSVTVSPEELPKKVFWNAVVPYGFTPEMAPDSLLARCWNDDLSASMSPRYLLQAGNYHYFSRLGAEKGFRSYTGLEFVLEPLKIAAVA